MKPSRAHDYDAIVVGAGPNGLAAAITMRRAGCSVLVLEAKDTIGGGMRTCELTLPGYLHDVCSAIHPLGVGSPFFRSIPLDEYGLEWIQPPIPFVHPLDGGSAVALQRSISATAEGLPGKDQEAYTRLMGPLVRDWPTIDSAVLGPFRFPRHPFMMARFGLQALQPAYTLAKRLFKSERGQALFGGLAGHAIQPLERPVTAAFGIVEGILGHLVGWPLPRRGSQSIADALAGYLKTLGGEIITKRFIHSLEDIPPAKVTLFDTSPQGLMDIAAEALPSGYRERLRRYRYGPGVFKIDYALSEPIPWTASEARQTATLHIGGTLDEIADAERRVWRGDHPEKPFVILVQPSLFDSTRAPQAKHTAWAYCHVPNGSTVDMTAQIEAQIERFAPGFSDAILMRSTRNTADLENYNPNYVGGDINAGVQDLGQLFTRPVARLVPYSTPLKGVFLCSSSTPPGGGVHGMCGYHAAQAALKAHF